ncbi:ATP-grasp domain-containing protein [Streptomyces tricolor]|nr:ATP-grasp domain-containing protein [Streptomyces tricolor]
MDFLIEDYIPGREFSFEVLVVDHEPHVVAVHEKCEVTETAGTVLENACVSPPHQPDPAADRRRDPLEVSSVLDTLGLGWGCFHIEARHTPSGWDLIEVNPRVGGSPDLAQRGSTDRRPRPARPLARTSLLAARRPGRPTAPRSPACRTRPTAPHRARTRRSSASSSPAPAPSAR